MREADARAVLLVAAVEEADPDGRLLGLAARTRATEEARAAGDDDEQALVVRRARALLPEVAARSPGLARLLDAGRVGGLLGPLVVVGALVVGLASHALGPERRINVLFAPMVGLVAWNLAVYAVVLLMPVRRAVQGRDDDGVAPPGDGGASPRGHATDGPRARVGSGAADVRRAVHAGGGLVAGLARALVERTCRRATLRAAEDRALVASAAARYAESWGAASAALLASRLTRLLHLGSMMLVTGAVAGMYVRGLGLAYRATWESTFLDAGQVQALLGVVLGPAAAVLGTTVPDVAAIAAPADGDAAPWIHLWAATGLLLVLLPRTLLWTVERARTRRLAEDVRLDLGAPALRRVLAPVRGGATAVRVVPYGVRLEPRAREALVERLHDVLGARADVAVGETLDYGAEADDVPDLDEGRGVVVLFPLAQSPEAEVHGAFVAGLARRVGAAAAPEREAAAGRVVVLVDGAGYRDRVADDRRLDERRRAWDRVLREVGAAAVHVQLDRPLDADDVRVLDDALSPVPAGAAR